MYTLGKKWRFKQLIVVRKTTRSQGATFYKINRGGDITYHGPGQIGLDNRLDNFFTDIHKYLRFFRSYYTYITRIRFRMGSDGETGVWLGVERHSLKFVHWGAQIALGNHARAFECKC
jgi:lipoyl(octanoyl) transferase